METNIVNPLISVIVPVYKVEEYIKTCLNSLLNQSYINWEAILVDDGSPDRSGRICDEYAANDKRFKVIHKRNGGLSSARNVAMDYIHGDYVFFLDSDDFLHKKAFQSLINLAIKHNADIVQCGFLYGIETKFPETSQPEKISIYNNRSIFTTFKAKIITPGKLYRKNITNDIKFPIGFLNEDDFTVWKYYYKAKIIVISNQQYYYYTRNPNGIMSNLRSRKSPDLRYFRAYEERISFFMKKNEKELEAISRIQWMKSLVLLFSNPFINKEQQRELMGLFKSNYISLKSLPFRVPFKLSVLFKIHQYAPKISGRIANCIYMNS